MKKTTICCDRCGKEITTGKVYQLATFISDPGKSWDLGDEVDTESGADLCEDCYQVIDDAVAAVMKAEKEKKPGKRPINRVDLDMGKVHALKNAGWSADKIGLEFGVSGQTILNRLKEEEENG